MTTAKHIVLTGTSRGLGRALVQPLIDRGHTISGCGRSASAAEAFQQIHGDPHRFACVDVSDAGQVTEWAAAVVAANGPPDLLLNNAGVINRGAPFWEISAEEFAHVLTINVIGSANVLRQFLPAMIDAGNGVIVNFSSGWGRHGAADVVPYCTSKFAVEGLSQALADEVPKGLAVVSLNPGIINTDMLKTVWGEGATRFPSAESWALPAVDLLLGLSAADNGKRLSLH
ncbi:MAG: SDR family oxidoreductase [Desulfosarcinaceae bacterium]|nr:SDR family oxidoreductase [Desulfosarcinaceae bacterium]